VGRPTSKMTQLPKAEIVVQIRRDYEGKVFSEIVDRSLKSDHKAVVIDGHTRRVVIDRQRGRQLDSDTVISRAIAVARCLRVPYDEDLHWPCKAVEGYAECHCPRCAKIADDRAGRKNAAN
jgi:hypothetical protein